MKKVLRRLDSIHQKLLSDVAALEPELYSQRPTPAEWSVAENLHHLCLVEARVIKELERAIAGPPQRVGFLRRLIPTSIVALRVVRVKAPKAMDPLDAPAKEVAITNYDRTRNNLKMLCDTHGTERFRNLIFKHPVLGNIDGVATVSFVGYHEKRHYKQIREVLNKLQPKSAADSRRYTLI
jgi:hypothetical protein